MPQSSVWEGHYEMLASVCLSVCVSVCCVPRFNSRTERLRKPKIGKTEAYHTVTREPI